MTLSFTDFTRHCQSRLETLFNLYLDTSSNTPLQKAMHYAVLNGGKRIRPLLVYATGQALDAPLENIDLPACAVELIHSYSLIHDDLPAMDNADFRRGKPSCHRAFNEAIAILAGDALQPLAFEIIASHPARLSAEKRLQMINVLCHASGLHGMAAGQALDIAGIASLEALQHMHQLKTGALIEASIQLGLLAAEIAIDKETEALFNTFGKTIGLAFQIQDDLLDIESNMNITGKPQGIDYLNNKITYPTLLGLETTRTQIDTLFKHALEILKPLGSRAALLSELAQKLFERRK
jgi:farnesyl diphosphate synthase